MYNYVICWANFVNKSSFSVIIYNKLIYLLKKCHQRLSFLKERVFLWDKWIKQENFMGEVDKSEVRTPER